jgi:hypothetical protein
MTRDNKADDSTRRTVLKTLAAAGIAGAGVAGASGSAAAQGQRGGSYRNRLRFDGPVDEDNFGETQDVWEGTLDPEYTDLVESETEATFDGRLDITGLEIVDQETAEELAFDGQELRDPEDDENPFYMVASGRLQGRLDSNPTTQINETFQTVIGLLEDIIGLLEDLLGAISPDEPQECPILFLDVGPIFLDLLGLQVDVSQIVIDITAVAGEGNLLGNLLCAVAGLLDP